MLKKIIIIAALLLSMAAVPAYAADPAAGNTDVKADSGNRVEIVLQLGSGKISVNGEESVIEPPYLSQETTLVPLRVITTSLGAGLEWDGVTQTIVLTHGEKNIKLVIGSKTAEVNGVAAKIPAAPELKNDTTMVPLRFIVEYFGATIDYESLEAPIRIIGSRQEAGAASGSEIDSDVGKIRIGNSQYSWTMNYPTGLIKSYQSFLEDVYRFDDAGGEYQLWVEVYTDQDRISNDRLLQKAADLTDGTIVQKSFVTNTQKPERSYALIISKDSDGFYDILRAYQWEESIYYVWLTINKPEDYKNADKNKKYTELLDSFTPTFKTGDREAKDLSTVKDGYRTYIGADLGLNLSVPADWDTGSNSEWVFFFNPDGDQGVNIRRTSVVQGDTLDQWIQREAAYITDEYQPEYRKLSDPSSVKIAGADGKLLNYSTSEDGKTWNQVYGYYLFIGDYKYEIDFLAFKSEHDVKQIQTIVDSMASNPSGNEDAGFIQDNRDFIDRTQMSTMKFKSLNYAVNIPDYWMEDSTEDGNVTYSSAMGSISLYVIEDVTLTQFKETFDKLMESNKQLSPGFRVDSSTVMTYAGVTAFKYVYSGVANGTPFETTSYMMEKNGKVYGIDFAIMKAHATPKNLAMQRAILDSFTFLN